MALKLEITPEEYAASPPALREAYRQVGDIFVPDLEGIENAAGLLSAFEKGKSELAELRARSHTITPEMYAEAEEKLAATQKRVADLDAAIAGGPPALEQKHAEQLAEWDQKAAQIEQRRKAHFEEWSAERWERYAAEAIRSAGGDETTVRLLSPILIAQTRPILDERGLLTSLVVIDRDGQVRLGADGRPLPVARLVEELRLLNPDASRAFPRNGKPSSGSGAP